jgi:hypothetical protein
MLPLAAPRPPFPTAPPPAAPQLSHPCLMYLVGVGTIPGTGHPFVATELLAGGRGLHSSTSLLNLSRFGH